MVLDISKTQQVSVHLHRLVWQGRQELTQTQSTAATRDLNQDAGQLTHLFFLFNDA